MKSLLIGQALDYPGVLLGELHKKNYFLVRDQSIGVIQVWGQLQFDKGHTYVNWDIQNLFNKRSYNESRNNNHYK